MDLYINGSNRKKNCYKILNDLKKNDDKLISLSDKNIKYCLGCNSCINKLENYCVIKDDMQEIYESMLLADKIIIASPIYMNHITGILKNVIDRLNPFSCHLNLKGKKIYLITIGQMDENENKEISESIEKYFESLSEFMEFEFHFIRNLSSGDVEQIDDVTKIYENYDEIIKEIKEKVDGI